MNMGLGLGVPSTVSKRRPEVTALFRQLKSAVGTYVVREQWNPTDMRIRVLFVMPDTTGWQVLVGNDYWDAGSGWILYLTNNKLLFQNAGTTSWVISQALTPGTLYEAVIERIGDDHSIHVAGVTNTATFAAAHSAPVELYFGCRHTNDGLSRTDFFNDKLVLAELTDLNDSSNCGRYSKFCDPSRIMPNDLATLGAELWNWIGDLPYNVNVDLGSGLVSGNRYLVSVDGLNASEDFRFFGQNSWQKLSNGQNLVIAAGSGATFRDFGSAQTGLIISIQEAPGYGTLNNPAEGSVSRYTKKGQAWLGPELVVNGGFDNGLAGWVTNGVSVVDGVVVFTDGGNSWLFQDCAPPDQQVRVSFDGYLVGDPQLKAGDNSNPLGRIQFNGNAGSTVDNVSVKHLIPIATGAM